MKLDRDRLIRAREVLGYGLEKTAKEAGISKNSVLRAEHEEDIRPGTARKIAIALGVRVADLVIEEGETLKDPAPHEEEIYDPRASELRRENYLTTLFTFARKQTRRWEKEQEIRAAGQNHAFFAWAREVLDTANTFSSTVFNGDVLSHSIGVPSKEEEYFRNLLLTELGKIARITEQILVEWRRRIDEMEEDLAREQRQEMERYNEEFQRIVADNFSQVAEHAASG